MKRILTIILIVQSSLAFSQASFNKIQIIPEVSAGYIIGVSFVWGVDVNITSFDFNVTDNISSSTGIGFSYSRFKYQRSSFNSYGLNLVNFTPYSQIKFGGKWLKTKWGQNKINKSHSKNIGFNFEIGGSPGNFSPWITFKTFGESNQCLWLPIRKQYQFNLKYLYFFPVQLKS